MGLRAHEGFRSPRHGKRPPKLSFMGFENDSYPLKTNGKTSKMVQEYQEMLNVGFPRLGFSFGEVPPGKPMGGVQDP